MKKLNQNIANATKQMGNATAWIATLTLVIAWISVIDIIFYYRTSTEFKYGPADIKYIMCWVLIGVISTLIIALGFFFYGHNVIEFFKGKKKRNR